MKKTICLVDSFADAKDVINDKSNKLLATDNPLLAEKISELCDCVDLDALISTKEAMKVGQFGVEVALIIDEKLKTNAIAKHFSIETPSIKFAGGGARLLTGQIYRATALAKALNKCAVSSIHINAVTSFDSAIPRTLLPDRFLAPWSGLSALGFFGSLPVLLQETKGPIPQFNQTKSESLFRRVLSMSPLAMLGVLACNPHISKIIQKTGRPIVLIESENELIRETMGRLTLNGVALQRIPNRKKNLDKPKQPVTAKKKSDFEESTELVESHIKETLRLHLKTFNWFKKKQIDALSKYIARHYASGLSNLSEQMNKYCAKFDQQAPELLKNTAVLSNSTLGSEAAWLHHHLRKKNIPLFGFEHGVTTGLSKHSESKIAFSEMTSCDEAFVYSENAKASFSSHPNTKAQIHVVGGPSSTKKMRLPTLQKYLVRNAIKTPSKHPILMHVDTLSFQGNLRAGPYAYTESQVIAFHRQILREVYQPLVSWSVLFKEYPTQRFIFEPRVSDYSGDNDRIQYLSQEDFRYVRAAADVLVTTMPSSTIGWCIGADVPLIWLESPVTPLLTKQALESFKEAFFVINMNDSDWTKQLYLLLKKGLPHIKRQWREKSAARDETKRKYIFGPEIDSDKACANIILNRIRPS